MKKLVFLYCLISMNCFSQLKQEELLKLEIQKASTKVNQARATKDLINNNIEWANLAYDAIKIYVENNMRDSAFSAFEVLTLKEKEREFLNAPLPTFMNIETKNKLKKICFEACTLLSKMAEPRPREMSKENDYMFIGKVYETMAAECHLLGDYFSAYNYQGGAMHYLHMHLMANEIDSNYEEVLKRSKFLDNFYKRQIENDDFSSENKIKNLALKQQTKLKNIFVGGFSVLTVMIFFLTYFIIQRNKANKELNKALIDLKGTQEQLVHQEKMASLGQLTSGIAHEMQNPLNFVNNFSELSFGLIKAAKGTTDKEEQTEILDNLFQNLEKINHHGKRAENVVKNMLLYSRTGHAEKQEINLNSFTDEILNLSYQSFQAKYPDFECEIKRNHLSTPLNVNAIPQDFSRMLLNLFNNAFYALREKMKRNISGYNPILKVSSLKDGQKIILKINDNGIGISVAIQDKIYNPFFTTKPTGEGTGLGLGIGYDIIKAHGGELNFKSVEGEFTEFEIRM